MSEKLDAFLGLPPTERLKVIGNNQEKLTAFSSLTYEEQDKVINISKQQPQQVSSGDGLRSSHISNVPLPPERLSLGQGAVEEDFRRIKSGEIRETKIPVSDIPRRAAESLPESGREFIKSTVQPILHPIETADSLKTLSVGVYEKFTPGEQPEEKAVDAMAEFFNKRYGGIEEVKKTMSTDPVGFAADLSTFLTAAGGIAKGVGKVSKVGAISKTGEVLSKAGKSVDPIRVAGAVVHPAVKGIGKFGEKLIGDVLTGVGAENVPFAIENSAQFRSALKGETSLDDLFKTGKGALKEIKTSRSTNYLKQYENIKGIDKSLDISPIRKKLFKKYKDFNIKVMDDGTLDFSRSTINKKAYNDITEINDIVKDWGLQKGDRTPRGVDILKRKLDDFYTESKNSKVLVSELRNEAKSVLNKNVPGYAEMTKEYQEISNIINDIEKGLSLGNKSQSTVGMRKLINAMNKNNEVGQLLVKKLEEVSGINMRQQIAGFAFKPLTAQNMIGKGLETGIGLGVLYQGFSALSPTLLLGFAATSPRMQAEFLNVLGKSIKAGKAVSKIATPAALPAFQAGRLKQIEQENRSPVFKQ